MLVNHLVVEVFQLFDDEENIKVFDGTQSRHYHTDEDDDVKKSKTPRF